MAMKMPCVALLFAAVFIYGHCAEARQPEVTITYDAAPDDRCAADRGVPIRDGWKTELRSRLPEVDSLWKAVGPNLIEAAEAITGKSFSGDKIAARLTLCDVPSQSSDVITINMRYALRSFTPAPVPMRPDTRYSFHWF